MKLVKEHINFQKGLDPKKAMSTGIYYAEMGTINSRIKSKNKDLNNIEVNLYGEWIKLTDYLKEINVTARIIDMDGSNYPILKYLGSKQNLIKLFKDLYDKVIDDNGQSETSYQHIKKDEYIK
ncbi:MAG: hypothetical protein WC554_13250 [Clostridia bacterium]|jgi:hypothetical protein